MEQNTDIATDRLGIIPVSKWNKYYPFPTVGALRQLIFSNSNGFNDKVIRKVGNRLYINVEAFFKWVEECSGHNVPLAKKIGA